jgi:phosphate transport system permease protein
MSPVSGHSRPRTFPRFSRSATEELTFRWLTLAMACSVIVMIVLIGYELASGSELARHKLGWHFLLSSDWDQVKEKFGALPAIFGTVVASVIALCLAVPVSIATAVYLTELAPRRLQQMLSFFIELLAAVPSVILGFWGLEVMVPWLRQHLYPGLLKPLGFLPWFRYDGPMYGPCSLSAGIILAIMIVPIITSVSREILRSVPGLQREAVYALGATRWEVVRIAVLGHARRGLFGAVILGLGRALGETIAVTMLIGNGWGMGSSLFAPRSSLTSVIANEFAEATSSLHLSSLFELGLVLLGITMLINAAAQLLLKSFAGPVGATEHG